MLQQFPMFKRDIFVKKINSSVYFLSFNSLPFNKSLFY